MNTSANGESPASGPSVLRPKDKNSLEPLKTPDRSGVRLLSQTATTNHRDPGAYVSDENNEPFIMDIGQNKKRAFSVQEDDKDGRGSDASVTKKKRHDTETSEDETRESRTSETINVETVDDENDENPFLAKKFTENSEDFHKNGDFPVQALFNAGSGDQSVFVYYENWLPSCGRFYPLETMKSTGCDDALFDLQERNRVLGVLKDNYLLRGKLPSSKFTQPIVSMKTFPSNDDNFWLIADYEYRHNKLHSVANMANIYYSSWCRLKTKIINKSLGFEYITHNVITEGAKMKARKCNFMGSTQCLGHQKRLSEHFQRMTNRGRRELFYDDNGVLEIPVRKTKKMCFVRECSILCQDNDCRLKTIQRGTFKPLMLFYEGSKGWGVRAAKHIKRGEFIIEYVGEVVTAEEADATERVAYVMTTFSGEFYIDAEKKGNISRFINHMCDPNVLVVEVVCDELWTTPRVAFFARRDIHIGEELGLSYWPQRDGTEKLVKRDMIRCRCSSRKCWQYLPHHM